MSLREQFAPDLESVFINTSEHATVREFRISDGHGGFKLFMAKVVWDTDAAKESPLVKIHGMFLGDVICYIQHHFLPRRPVAGELIYSPANQPWEIVDCMDEEGCYLLGLYSTRSQPAAYGAN